MNPLVPLLALPFCLAAGLALAWLRHRLPPGWKGIVLGFAALAALSLLAFGGWMFSLTQVTWANYACIDCGRVERQTHLGPCAIWRTLEHDDDEYLKRFAPELLRGHAHHWHRESCLFSALGVGCTMEYVAGWFEVLPKLADRSGAEALFREAQALPYEQRCRLMNEVAGMIGFARRDSGGIDAAFAKWRTERTK